MDNNYRKLKYACYTVNLSMSIVANMSPVLFLTFRTLYGISYSLLGLLVLINFLTQLTVDLVFSFFSHKFNISKAVKATPVLTIIGLLVYGIWPYIFNDYTYVGLVLGTLIFSAASGFAEVLISPVIAAIPSENPEMEMSKLHSVYAWGVVPVIIISTLFIYLFGGKHWQLLVFVFTIVPIISAILFCGTIIPEMKTPQKVSGTLKFLNNKTLWLCVVAIFLGGAAECTMAQWASGYLEQSLNIPKIWGDIFGVSLFAVALGLGRTLYSKKGKNIKKVLLLGGTGAAICYFVVAITPYPIVGLIACAFTGFCTSMLWPGSLIVASEKFPESGVFIFAMMAAGGDLGASVVPQLVGIVTDVVIKNPAFINIATTLSITTEQLGMKTGILFAMLFPLASIVVYSRLKKPD